MPAPSHRRSSGCSRRFVLVALAATLVAVSSGHAIATCWPMPTTAPVVDPYREPACPWCPGNRGIEYATGAGEAVVAIAAGTVTFAGTVAGVRYVVVRVADGRRITYGNLTDLAAAEGQAVVRGTRLGVTAGHLHLGLRVGDGYVDPAPFLGVERGVVRLVPADGSPAPPGPPPRLHCPADG